MPARSSDLVRGGHGEPTLDERYGLVISLPMPEAQFVEMIRGVPLPIHRAGERGSDHPTLMRPFHYRGFDMSAVSHGYLVDGGYNRERQRNELYVAYVDRSGNVVYVENQFGYPP